jgi:hypothetical protein
MSVTFTLLTRFVTNVSSRFPSVVAEEEHAAGLATGEAGAEHRVGALLLEDLHDAEDVARVVLEVRVVDDRDRAGRLRERGLDCGALAAVAIVLEEDPLDLPAPSAAALERVGRRRARARRRGKRGRERDPALGGEQPEHLGGSRPGGPAVQLDGIDVGPSTARVFGPSGARAELPRTPLFTGKLSAPSAR